MFSKATVNRCVLSRRRKTGRLFASMTEVGRLFQMAGTAELKARLPMHKGCVVLGVEDESMSAMSSMNKSVDWRSADEGIQVAK